MPVWTPVGQVQAIGDISVTAEEVDVTTLDAGGYRDYIQGFKDPGECELTLMFDPGLPSHDDSANGLIGLFEAGTDLDCAIRWNSSGTGGEAFGTFQAFIRDMTYGALNADDPQTITPLFRLKTSITLVDTLPTTRATEEGGGDAGTGSTVTRTSRPAARPAPPARPRAQAEQVAA